MEDRRRDDAEAEIRKGIAVAQADPDRWLSLVRFAVLTDQPAKAEKVVHEAEAHLVKQPLALAQCCQLVGGAYAAVAPDRAKPWFDQARHWLGLAQAEIKDPDDVTVKVRFADFLLQIDQLAEAEGVFKEILARADAAKSPDIVARRGATWPRCTCAPPRRGPPRPRPSSPARRPTGPSRMTCVSWP